MVIADADVGATGALISEHAHLDLTDGIIHTTGSMPENPLLAEALENLRPFEGRGGPAPVVAHADDLDQVVDASVASGTLSRKGRHDPPPGR